MYRQVRITFFLKIIFVYKSPCPGNAELSVNYLNKVMQYERDNSPYQHEVSCGIFDDGDVGCIDKTKSEKLREKIIIIVILLMPLIVSSDLII